MSDDDRVQPQDENQAQDENPPEHLDAGVGLDNAFFELNSKGAGGYSDEEPATEMDGNSKYEPSPSKRTKNKKKKSKQRRKRRRESSSSSSSSSSDSSDSSDDDKSPPEKRFRVVSKEEEHKWDLPSDMALYANKYFHEYVPEKDIQEKILDQDPVPSNITEHKKLDDFVKSAVKSTSSIMNDQSLEKIQLKVGSVMGPLSKLWRVLEGVKTSPGDNVDVPVDLCVTLVHKCVLLLGQASNAISYSRRFNLLSNMLNDPRRAKSVLKEKAPVLQTNDENLFGKKFRSYVIETERSKKKTVEAFASESRKQPFQLGPPSQSTKKSGGGGRYTYRKNNNQRGKKYGGSSYNNYNSNNNSGKKKLSKRLSLPNNAGYSSRKPTFKCPSLGKTYVYRRDSDFTTGRQTKIFSPSMGKTDNGQRNPVDCKRGFRDSFLQKTNSGKNSSDCSNVDRRKTNSERRNSGNATERCNSQSGQQQKGQLCSTAVRNIRSVSKQSVCCPKKGWGKQASNKSEKSKFLYSLQTLQNGRFGQFKTFIEKRGLSYKNRLERCILYRTSVEFFQEICTFQMGRKSLRVPVSLFWFGASPSNFHQTTENSHSSSPKNQHSSDYLPGRHVINGVHFRGNKHEQGYSSFPFTTPRICNKSEEISADSLSQNGIPGVNYRYNGNENISYRGKGAESHPEMFRSVPTESSIDLRIDQVDRLTVFNHSSSTSSIITTSLSTATASAISEENQILSDSSSFNKGSESRTFVVDSKFKNTEWKENKFEGTQLSDPDRCFQRDRLGSSLQWSQDRRDLVDTGNRQTYPYSRITCSQVSLSQFHQEPSKHSHSFSDRQYNCNFLSIENGGNKKSGIIGSFQGNLEISDIQRDHDYSRISPWNPEQISRLGVTEPYKQLRMDSSSINLSTHNKNFGLSTSGSICIQIMPPDIPVCSMETRPHEHSNRCNAAGLEQQSRVCFPTILYDHQGAKQSFARSGRTDDYCDTNMADTALVQPTFTALHSSTSLTTQLAKHSSFSEKGKTSFDQKQNIKTGGMVNFRQKLQETGISETAATLITNSRRSGSLSGYESAWRKWSSWCSSRQVDPFHCDLTFILNFLADSYKEGLAYNTINVYRSTISAYHDPIEGRPVGTHPNVCKLLAGVFNNRPPQPRYTFVWDVETVLVYLNSLGSNENLSLKILSYKLVMLLALTSASRTSAIQFLSKTYMSRFPDRYVFYFNKLHKSWRRGKPPPKVDYVAFPENKTLCVVKCLDDYLNRTSALRKAPAQEQLLLATIQPHGPVVRSTISGWIVNHLRLAGIDTNTFKAHSTRSASSSKAKVGGASIQDILSRGAWSTKSSTWQRFYHKEIISPEQNFQNSVFGGKTL